MFDDVAGRYSERVMMDFFGAGTTYGEAATQIKSLAAGLRELGVRPGDHVAVILPNCPQHVLSIFAIQKLGATVATHNPLYTARELEGPFLDHGATIAIVWDKIVPMAKKLMETTQLNTIISVNMIQAMPLAKRLALKLPLKSVREKRDLLHAPAPGTISFKQLLSPNFGGDGFDITNDPSTTSDTNAFILFTSGTSGKPKGSQLTHGNVMATVTQASVWPESLGEEQQERFLAAIPLFHIYGLTLNAGMGISTGGKILLLPKPEIPLIVAQFKRELPTYMPGVPTLYEKILTVAKEENLDLSGIANALSGAAPLPVELSEEWERRTGGKIVEGYGLTEIPIVTANPSTPDRRAGFVGLPFPSTEVRVVNPQDRSQVLPPGEAGELLVRGPQVFKGYLNIPEEEQPFHDGWFCTGDMAVVEEDGFVRIVSRIKEMIITGGFNVYPAEVEEVLMEHEHIERVGVIGLPQPNGSEEVVAAVTLAAGVRQEEFDAEAVRAWARKQLTAYKVPRRFFVVEAIPSDLMGKTRRREVKDLVQTLV